MVSILGERLKEKFFTRAGAVNWSENSTRSWGTILLILGGYGIVGLVPWSALIFYPLFLTVKQLNLNRRKTGVGDDRFALVMAVALMASWVDTFLNSFFIVSSLILSGGLVSVNLDKGG
jgi:O-antigen ligase